MEIENLPLKFFIFYAESDKESFLELEKHLRLFTSIELWHPDKLIAGALKDKELLENLISAQVIIFLLSPDFCVQAVEEQNILHTLFRKALEKREEDNTTLIPVVLRSCGWDSFPILKDLLPFPKNGKAILTHDFINNRDFIYVEFVNLLKYYADKLSTQIISKYYYDALPEIAKTDPQRHISGELNFKQALEKVVDYLTDLKNPKFFESFLGKLKQNYPAFLGEFQKVVGPSYDLYKQSNIIEASTITILGDLPINVLIMIEPFTQDSLRFTLESWLILGETKEKLTECSEESLSLEQIFSYLKDLLLNILVKQYQISPARIKKHLCIHLFLPYNLFDEDFYGVDLNQTQKLGATCKIVIRSIDRVKSTLDPFTYDTWLEKWKKLNYGVDPKNTICPFDDPQCIEKKQKNENPFVGLAREEIACMTMSFRPNDLRSYYKLLQALIDSVTPAALWVRKPSKKAIHDEVLKRLPKYITTQTHKLQELPEIVKLSRYNAYNSNDFNDPARHINLYWDDPTVLPNNYKKPSQLGGSWQQ